MVVGEAINWASLSEVWFQFPFNEHNFLHLKFCMCIFFCFFVLRFYAFGGPWLKLRPPAHHPWSPMKGLVWDHIMQKLYVLLRRTLGGAGVMYRVVHWFNLLYKQPAPFELNITIWILNNDIHKWVRLKWQASLARPVMRELMKIPAFCLRCELFVWESMICGPIH